MSAIDDAMTSLDQMQASAERLLMVAASSLRDAVEVFNAQPVSLSSIDAFREHVLHVADRLAAPLPEAPSVRIHIEASMAEIHRIGESRRVGD